MKIHVHLHLPRDVYLSLQTEAGALGLGAEVWMESILRRAAKEFAIQRKQEKRSTPNRARAR